MAAQIQQQLQGTSSSSTSTHTPSPLPSNTPTNPPSSSSPSVQAALSAGELLAQLRRQSAQAGSQSQSTMAVGEGQTDQQPVSSLLTAQLASALGIDTASSPSSSAGQGSVAGKVRTLRNLPPFPIVDVGAYFPLVVVLTAHTTFKFPLSCVVQSIYIHVLHVNSPFCVSAMY